jgi:hypothetical protein
MNLARLLLSAALLAPAVALAADDGGRYDSVESFIKSTSDPADNPPEAVAAHSAYGDLAGKGRQDWAGILLVHEAPKCQGCKPDPDLYARLFVLLKEDDGRYRLAVASGTAELDYAASVSITRQSVFLHGESTHGLGSGNATSDGQYKLYKGQWRLVGAQFHHTRFVSTAGNGDMDDEDDSDIDRNVLTGDVIIKIHLHGEKPAVRRMRLKSELILLQDQGLDALSGWLPEFDQYAY